MAKTNIRGHQVRSGIGVDPDDIVPSGTVGHVLKTSTDSAGNITEWGDPPVPALTAENRRYPFFVSS